MEPFSAPWFGCVAIIIVGIGIYIWKSYGFLFLGLRLGTNDPEFVTNTFDKLLFEARDNLLLCDDGNIMVGSIYENKSIIATIAGKLKENQEFEIFCVFHSNDDTEFIKHFSNNHRVHIARGVSPRPEVHFKIIDDGKKGYLTVHDLESLKRHYRLYDCSWVPKSIKDAALGRHVQWAKAVIERTSDA